MAVNATGAPLPGLNATGISPEGLTTVVTVVDRFLTYCPEPTVFVWAGRTYSVDAPATVTISDCEGGCTIATVSCVEFLKVGGVMWGLMRRRRDV